MIKLYVPGLKLAKAYFISFWEDLTQIVYRAPS